MQTLGQFPQVRMRRMRHDDFSRRLMRENVLTVNDLILPVFVKEGKGDRQPIPTMPGVVRYTLDELLKVCGQCVDLGIPMVALFPAIDSALKTADGSEATNPDGLIPRVVHAIKEAYPELGVMCDVALDPYTTHGQDGLIDQTGYILNDETVQMLIGQALAQAKAGADVVAPSDMMDGRIRLWKMKALFILVSWRTRPNTHRPFTGRFVMLSARVQTWENPTKTFTSKTRPTATKPCGKSVWIWPKGPTWSWSNPAFLT